MTLRAAACSFLAWTVFVAGHAARADDPAAAPWAIAALPKRVGVLAVSADGKRLATGAADGGVRVFDVATCAQTASLEGHKPPVQALGFVGGDGGCLASLGFQDFVRAWDVEKRAALHDFPEPALRPAPGEMRVLALACMSKQKRIAVPEGDDVAVWDAPEGKRVAKLVDVGPCWGLAFSPDGARLATLGMVPTARGAATFKSALAVRNVAGGKAAWTDDVGDADSEADWRAFKWASPEFSPDGKKLFVEGSVRAREAQRTALRRYDTAKGARDWTVETDRSGEGFRVSPDGSLLAVASQRGAVLLDAATGRLLRTLQPAGEGCTSVCFSPDGAWVYGATLKRTIVRWETPPPK